MAVALVCGSADLEPGAGQRRVPVRVDGDGHRGRKPERIDGCKKPVGKVRAGIEQRRGKHVAGNPADRIEVKAGETVARRRTLRFVRVRVRRYGGGASSMRPLLSLEDRLALLREGGNALGEVGR